MKTRRPTPYVAFFPNAACRVSSAGKKQARRPSPDARRPGAPRAGMTMIELGIVMGIVSILLALVLSLGRHVNAVVKIRKAQADLGEWHETLNRWHLQFGEYPYATIDTETGTETNPLSNGNQRHDNLTDLLEHCEIRFKISGTTPTNITFRSYLTSGVSHIDPWGTPYIYDCDPGRKAYTLFSCGPDGKTKWYTTGADSDTYDDIYFER